MLRPKSESRSRPCARCGRLVRKKPAELRFYKQTFCSRACQFPSRQRTCAACGKAFTPRWQPTRFCSFACYQRINPASWVERPCTHCGSLVKRRKEFVQSKRGQIFCGLACSQAYQRGEKAAAWRGGIGGTMLNRGLGWAKRAARIRARDGYKCRRCGKTQEENGRKLPVDHVRPWREFPDDEKEQANADENLVSLCTSCHGKKLKLENRWLRGDGLALQEYRRSVGLAS